jgi:hypothetical protein
MGLSLRVMDAKRWARSDPAERPGGALKRTCGDPPVGVRTLAYDARPSAKVD